MAGVDITNFTRRPVPRFAYAAIAEDVLPDWDISLVFVGPVRAQKLNVKLRGKSYVPNVLSYEAGHQNGEIFICLEEAERQAHEYEMDKRTFVLYLFIHALLHLKGWPHGATMERWEKKLVARFAQIKARTQHVTQDNDRHRHRHLPSKGSGGRGSRR